MSDLDALTPLPRLRHRSAAATIARFGVTFGVIGFVGGFFGPMLLSPDANQGPMLGIFITGPLGLLAGLVIGAAVTIFGRT